MADASNTALPIDRGQLGEWAARRPYLWQMNFLSAGEFARLTGVFGFGLRFDEGDILHLWQLGLLTADVVRSRARPRGDGFVLRASDEYGQRSWSDERRLRARPRGFAGTLSRLRLVPEGTTPLFHPFRFFVLHHLDRALRPMTSPVQHLWTRKAYRWAWGFSWEAFQRWSQSPGMVQVIERWNDIAAVVIALEPCFYQRISGGSITTPSELLEREDNAATAEEMWDAARERLRRHIGEHWARVAGVIRRLGISALETLHQDLCIASETLDPNKDLHTLLRLQDGRGRLELKGRLGGAIQLNTMAKMRSRPQSLLENGYSGRLLLLVHQVDVCPARYAW